MLARLLMGVVCAVATYGSAAAQSFDCARARSPAERAICSDPALGALDRALAGAFTDALTRTPDAAALRTAQQQWVRTRDTACAVPAARLSACLTQQMNGRLAALAVPAFTAPATTPAPVVAAAALALPPVLPEPAIPAAGVLPIATATLDRAEVSAADPATLLRVTTPGRFALQVRSATGASLELVDMLTGPSDPAGEAGARDGRLDRLLDVGTYKLRATVAPNAGGAVQMSVQPFRDAAQPQAAPPPGIVASAALTDLQQRAYWLMVGPGGTVRIDAAGRALADLRLWRNGADLVPLDPDPETIEPQPGHRMLRLRLAGTVEPGAYLLVAYGGPPLAWPDGDAAQPFHLRSGASDALQEGWAAGTIGPLGSALFSAPARGATFRLDLPASAPATLAVDGVATEIAANSRMPRATLQTEPLRTLVEVTGKPGQAFVLRAFDRDAGTTLATPGAWWLSALALGTGGDDVPPTVLLARSEPKLPTRVVAGNLPEIGPAAPWRARFNLRGPTSILLRNTLTTPFEVRNAGQPLGQLRAEPGQWDLPADYLRYVAEPTPGRQGIADLVFGPAGAAAEAVAPLPADPVVPLGLQTIAPGQRLQLRSNDAPGVTIRLLARPSPVALAEGPLTVTQAANAGLEVAVTLAAGGQLAVSEPGVGPVPFAFRTLPGGAGVVTVPGPARPRTVVLAWRRPVAPRPDVVLPPAGAAPPALLAGTPRFFDLANGGQASFDLTVAEGGLYRVETLGRQRTTGSIGTSFVAELDRQIANGIGQNMLLQRWLRAGQYRVRVATDGSAGHLGLQATPATLRASTPLTPGGSVRARLPAGTGLRIPVEITERGTYHLDLRGLNRTFTARLDDAEGWPLLAPGPLTELDRELTPGRYQLLVQPEAVEARVVARLARVVTPPEPEGHGPHLLTWDSTRRFVWREPPGRDDARAPDVWTFSLAGPADITVGVTDGMVAALLPDDQVAGDPTARPIARLVSTAAFKGRLDAGSYRVEATSLGRNDRLDYGISLSAKQLQPGVVRTVGVGAQVPFTIDAPRVVSLTSFGDVPLKAVLRDGSGAEIARYGDRGADWNIAISRPLPAGSYRLDLSPAVPPDGTNVARAARPDADAASDSDDEPAAQSVTADTETTERPEPSTDEDTRTVELRLALPAAHDTLAASAGPVALTGGGVHRIAVAPPAVGDLLVATAASSADLVLALERRDTDASPWMTVALAGGTAPVAAAAADEGKASWRLSVWTVDGGTEPIRASLVAHTAADQQPAQATLRPLDGAVPLAIAKVRLQEPVMVTLAGRLDGVLAGGAHGVALQPPEGDVVVPQDRALWLLAPAGAGTIVVTPVEAAPGQPITVPVPEDSVGRLAASAAAGLRTWVAQGGPNQPGLGAERGMGTAHGSAFALGDGPVWVWNAGGKDSVRLRITPLDLTMQPPSDGAGTMVLPSGSATPVTLPAGARRLTVALAPGVALVADWRSKDAVTAWGGDAPVTRSLEGRWTEALLVNTSSTPAPVSLSSTAIPAPGVLQPGVVSKRYFGAAGSFDLAVDAPANAHVVLAGDAVATVIDRKGQVRHGQRVALSGPGRVIVEHGTGPVALWIEADGSPWPAVTAQAAALPARLAMGGPAMALSLTPGGPVLMHARTTAPVILTLGGGPPTLFAAGAELHRYLAGNALLRVDSPHDGPLGGTLELSADPVQPVAEGLGAPMAVGPGQTALFGFQLARPATVGVGVRADPDRVETRLLDTGGATLAEGAALLRRLPAGRYFVEARVPPDAATTLLRPAVVGVTPRGSGPPPEVAQRYYDLVGLTPKDAVR